MGRSGSLLYTEVMSYCAGSTTAVFDRVLNDPLDNRPGEVYEGSCTIGKSWFSTRLSPWKICLVRS